MKIDNGRNLVFPQFQSLFDDFLVRDLSKSKDFGTLPAVNVKETDSAYELELAAPGMEKKDFKIELENDTLSISAQIENKSEEKESEGKYSRREFSYRSFRRVFNLPENMVNSEQVSANYKDGILHVIVPKKEQTTKTVKSIQID